ncbi:MAG: hypothetical protein AVDCRST_MAG13-2713, partial [uncultured Solirubrobacteraceae bacterium]
CAPPPTAPSSPPRSWPSSTRAATPHARRRRCTSTAPRSTGACTASRSSPPWTWRTGAGGWSSTTRCCLRACSP